MSASQTNSSQAGVTDDLTPIYSAGGTLLALMIDSSLWFPEDLELLYPDLLNGHSGTVHGTSNFSELISNS